MSRPAPGGPGGFVLLVTPRVFRAPEGPAAREARRPHFVRRRASKPALALPPPTGAAPRSPPVPSGPSGALHTGGAGCADDWLGVSSRSPARPCRRVACFVGLGRCVCRWAAARPRDRHTRASLGVVDLEARPGPAAAHRHRGRVPVVLQTSWAFAADGARRVGSMPCQAPTP